MSCPLPHVIVLINPSRRSASRFGEALRRVIVPRRLPLLACLVSSRSPVFSSRLSARRAGRFGDGRRFCLRLRLSCGCHADAVRRSVCCGASRFALLPVCLSPRSSTRRAGRGAGVLVACLFRISTVRRSRRHMWLTGAVCLLAPISSVVSVLRYAMCGFCGSHPLRLPGLLRRDIFISCRRGRMSAIAVHRNSLACFSIPISAPLFNSSPSSTPIKRPAGILLILSFARMLMVAAPFDAPRPVRLLDCGGRAEAFLCVLLPP